MNNIQKTWDANVSQDSDGGHSPLLLYPVTINMPHCHHYDSPSLPYFVVDMARRRCVSLLTWKVVDVLLMWHVDVICCPSCCRDTLLSLSCVDEICNSILAYQFTNDKKKELTWFDVAWPHHHRASLLMWHIVIVVGRLFQWCVMS